MAITEKITGVGFAKLCGVTKQTVANWCDSGMPHEGGGKPGNPYKINVRDALPWVVSNRTEKPGSERDRLAKEQADKFAIENAKSRGELLLAQQVEDVLSAALASLSTQLEGLPGRMATPLSSIEDPAIVRSQLQNEIRRIRQSYAQQFAELGDVVRDPEADQRDRKAPAKKKRKRVGRKKSRTSTRKR